jgi:hypothetical protein
MTPTTFTRSDGATLQASQLLSWAQVGDNGTNVTVSVVVAPNMRWRRGRQDSDKTAKRQTYADYLAALSLTRNDWSRTERCIRIPPTSRNATPGKPPLRL